ncbi:MAG: hypothetical protein QOE99_1953 [Actinomycetota bacterium]|jgi:hypothetical protein|nr:hypothetical protein [Actinomycetota bacterium]
MPFCVTIRARRHILAAVALAAAAVALPLPAVAGSAFTASVVTEGRDVAPVVVTVSDEAAARWMPFNRRRSAISSRLRTTAPASVAPATAPAAAPVTAPLIAPVTAPVAVPVADQAAPNLAASHATSFAFMSEVTPGDPIRWNPCTSVHWTFNPANAPAGGLAAVQSAVTRIGQATGLSFTYDGSASSVPTGSYLDSQTAAAGFRPLLVGWSTPSASTLLANQPSNLVGMDQTIWARPATGATHIVSGVVALNADVSAPSSGRNSWYTFALHELGHAVGLAHTADSTQIMNATIPAAATDYGSGDLAGLARVGGTC